MPVTRKINTQYGCNTILNVMINTCIYKEEHGSGS